MSAIGRWVKRILLITIGLIFLWQLWLLGWVMFWGAVNPDATRFMEIRLEELQTKKPDAKLKKIWIPYSKISVHLKRAIIAAEDAKFVDHEGFDWDGIQKAMEKNQEKGRTVAGGSTITQQLAKNLFLTPTKSYFRKIEEAAITLMLEAFWSKQRIFEVYLNVIEWGEGVFGAEAAARHYFNHSAASLGAEEAAQLAGIVPNPRYYDKHRGAPGLIKKSVIILGRMPSAIVP